MLHKVSRDKADTVYGVIYTYSHYPVRSDGYITVLCKKPSLVLKLTYVEKVIKLAIISLKKQKKSSYKFNGR